MLWTIIWFAVAAISVVADQITKILAVKYLVDGPVTVIPGVLNFTYVENDGMALGLMDDQRWIFMTLSTVAIIGLSVYMIGWRPKSRFACCALALIIGGGIGNMIDRLYYVGIQGETAGEHVVRDFIDVRIFGELWPWVFNVADSCVCVGGAMLFLWCVVSLIKESKEEKLAKAQKAAASTGSDTENTVETEGSDTLEETKTGENADSVETRVQTAEFEDKTKE